MWSDGVSHWPTVVVHSGSSTSAANYHYLLLLLLQASKLVKVVNVDDVAALVEEPEWTTTIGQFGQETGRRSRATNGQRIVGHSGLEWPTDPCVFAYIACGLLARRWCQHCRWSKICKNTGIRRPVRPGLADDALPVCGPTPSASSLAELADETRRPFWPGMADEGLSFVRFLDR